MNYERLKDVILERLKREQDLVNGMSDSAWNAYESAQEIVKTAFKRIEMNVDDSLSHEILKTLTKARQEVLEIDDPNDTYYNGMEEVIKRVMITTARYSKLPDAPAHGPKGMWWEFTAQAAFGERPEGRDYRVRIHLTHEAMHVFGRIFDQAGMNTGIRMNTDKTIQRMWIYSDGRMKSVEVRQMKSDEVVGLAGFSIDGEEQYG